MNLLHEGMKGILNIKKSPARIALRVSVVYALAGSLWILSSDTLLSLLVSEPLALTHLQTFKGWAFIAVTAFLLYVLVSRYVSAMEHSAQALLETEKKFRILVETAASAIFLYRDTFITVNRASEELTGYSEGELRRKPAPNKWSKKELMGHLIDSAANDHHRFIKAQFLPEPLFGRSTQSCRVECHSALWRKNV